MPAELYAVADSKIYIGGTLSTKKADFIASDFTSQTWVEVDGWETMGNSGDTAEVISTSLINRNRVIKQKGVSNAGSYEAGFVIIEDDPGQIALRIAQDDQENYAFKVLYPSGTSEYFIALVMTATNPGGDANTVLKLSATLEINSNIVRVVV